MYFLFNNICIYIRRKQPKTWGIYASVQVIEQRILAQSDDIVKPNDI